MFTSQPWRLFVCFYSVISLECILCVWFAVWAQRASATLLVGVKFSFVTPSILQRSGLQWQSAILGLDEAVPAIDWFLLIVPQLIVWGRFSTWQQPGDDRSAEVALFACRSGGSLCRSGQRGSHLMEQRETWCMCVLEWGALGNRAVHALKNNVISDCFCSKIQNEQIWIMHKYKQGLGEDLLGWATKQRNSGLFFMKQLQIAGWILTDQSWKAQIRTLSSLSSSASGGGGCPCGCCSEKSATWMLQLHFLRRRTALDPLQLDSAHHCCVLAMSSTAPHTCLHWL